MSLLHLQTPYIWISPCRSSQSNIITTSHPISPRPYTDFSSKPRWAFSSVFRTRSPMNSTITATVRRPNNENPPSRFQEAKMMSSFRALERRVESGGYKPDAVSYKKLIKGLCRIGKTKEAARVLEIFEQSGATPDVIMYTALIRGYCVEGNVDKALQLFDGMKVAPDVFTYNTLLKGLCDSGKLDRALQLLEGMKVAPNVVTYNTLLKGLCDSGELDRALQLLEGMKVASDVVTYTTLSKGFCDSGKLDRALELLDHTRFPRT